MNKEKNRDTKQNFDPAVIAQIAATLMSAGQIGINDLEPAVEKAKALLILASK